MQESIVGSYKLVDVLGQGSMGDVYLGRHLLFPREAAIKLIRPQLGASREMVDRMIREATAASAVDHPSILTVYEAGHTPDGGVYLALEFVHGQTLARRLDEGPLPIAQVLSLGRQVCEGLAELHARDVLHRDLKPSNLMLGARGQVKILDFGVALLRQREATPDRIEGTPVYMSPEQIRGESVDGRSDLFSLGAVLFETLTGRRAFDASHVESVMLRVLHEDPVDPRSLRPDAPAELVGLLQELVAKDPRDRPMDAGEAAARFADLEKLQPRSTEPASTGAFPGLPAPTDGEPSGTTVIVYPFENRGATPDRAYFGDGLAEAMSAALSREPHLTVMAAAAVRALRGKGVGPLDAAARLGAGRVCAGSAEWAGDRVRVSAQLLGTSAEVLWSHVEEGSEEDFFGLQDRLARALVTGLRPADATPREPLANPGRQLPPDALRTYQRGVAFLDDTTGFALRRAQDAFHQVLEADPSFAPARARLALAMLKRFLRFERRPELLEQAATHASQAATDDPHSALAMAVLGLSRCFAGDYAEGLRLATQACHADPNLAVAHLVRAHAAGFSGNLEVARAASIEAAHRDPLDPFILHFAALTVSEVSGEEKRGIDWLRRAHELAPGHLGSAVKLGEMYLLVHRPSEAREAFETALAAMPAGAGADGLGHAFPMAWDGIAWSNIGLGRFAEAARAARESIRHGGAEPPVVAHRMLAWAHVGLRDLPEAAAAGAEAERRARAYLDMNPRDFQYLMGLGEILTAAGRATEAVEPLREATRVNPASHMAWEMYARTLAVLREPDAVTIADRVYQESPESPAAAFTRYLVLDLVRPTEAPAALDTARRLGFAADGWLTLYRALAV